MEIFDDVKYSLRLLRKTPGFTLVTLVVFVLGLSLYMTSFTFSKMMTDQPMPFPNGDRYVSLKTVDSQNGFDVGVNNHDLYTYSQLKSRSDNYSVLGAFHLSFIVMSDGDYARRFYGATISTDFFNATAVSPLLGRTFSAEDTLEGAAKSTIVSYSLWQDYYAGDADVIGRLSRIDGETYTVIGVMPEGFKFPMVHDVWLPLTVSDSLQPGEGLPVSLAGILNDSATTELAAAEANALHDQLLAEFPDDYSPLEVLVLPYASISWLKASPLVDLAFLVTAVTVVVLLLTVINLASLLFIRSSTRRQELLIRSSVGASGWSLVKQVLLESFLICFSGFVLSLLLTVGLLQILENQLVNGALEVSFWFDLKLDADAITAGLSCMLIVWIFSGLVVAHKAYRSDPGVALGTASKGGVQGGKSIVSNAVVGIEMVLTCFLLICCGAVVYMLDDFSKTDLGIQGSPENYAIANFRLTGPDYEEHLDRLRYVENLAQRIAAMPGVSASAITTAGPGMIGISGSYSLDDRDVSVDGQPPSQMTVSVGDSYFETVGVGMIQGRAFDSTDSASSESVTIIGEDFARQLWPDSSAVGKRIQSIQNGEEQWLTVVGTIDRLLQTAIEISLGTPTLYRPSAQELGPNVTLVARVEPQIRVAGLEQQFVMTFAGVDRNIAIDDYASLQTTLSNSLGVNGVIIQIFIVFSIATLILASIGIYGVVARSITMKTKEIGVRRAVGSSDRSIITKFLRQGFRFLLYGVVFGGIPACAIASFLVPSLISGIYLPEFLTTLLLLVTSLMAVLIFTASYVPARRAVAIEPGDALRYE